MASFNRVTFSGSTDTISVPFGYLDKSHVVVSLNGVVLGSGAYSWPSNGQVKITAGNPAAGVVGEARRVTPADPLVNFEPGNLDTDDLDTASLQAIYIAEEAKDSGGDLGDRAWYTSSFQLGGTITKGSEDTVPKFDASGNLVPGPAGGDIELAQGYASAAGNSAGTAQGAATAASESAALAQQWASNPEDVEVTGGLFSAFHWYRKTLALWNSVVSGLAAAIHGAVQKSTLVDADEFGISDSAASWGLKRTTAKNVKQYLMTSMSVSGFRNLLINPRFAVNQPNVALSGTLAANAHWLDGWKAGPSGCTLSVTGGVVTITAGTLVQVIDGQDIESGTHVINWVGTAPCTVGGGATSKGGTFALTRGSNTIISFGVGTLSFPQVEAGEDVGAFERRHFAVELALCSWRYSWAVASGGSYQTIAGTNFTSPVSWSRKRATPVLAAVSVPVSTNVASAVVDNITADGARYVVVGSATAGVNVFAHAIYAVDARL